MPRKSQVSVEPRSDGRWAVQTDGSQRAYRVKDNKSEAVRIARRVAGNKGVELTIRNERGRIVGKDSRGNDPRRIHG
jgi:uncharacterized protein YdaT